jgi:hypothetical protein
MTTSGTYSYTSNRDFIITEAFRKAGGLGDGEPLDDARKQIGVNALGPMVKALQAHGLNVWTIDEKFVDLSVFSSAPAVTIGDGMTVDLDYKPLKLLEAQRYIDVELTSTPMIRWTNREWQEQPNKFQTGTPTHVYYRPDAYNGWLHVWPMPDAYWQANGALSLVFQRPIQDIGEGTAEVDFPAEWHEALIYQLAVRLAPNYGMAINDRSALRQEAKEALDLALSFDQEEGSLYIRPDRNG